MQNSIDSKPQVMRPNPPHQGSDGDVDIDVRGLLLMLWRRRLVILGMILIGMSLMMLTLSFVQPRYTARALLLIENKSTREFSDELKALLSTVHYDTSLILGEIEVLRSRTLGRKVVERLDLINDPDFNPRFKMADNAQGQINSVDDLDVGFKKLSVHGSEMDSLPDNEAERIMEIVISNYLEGLNVRSVPGSLAIQVEYISPNPRKAALIANTLVDVYIEQALEDKYQATKKVTDWLDRRLSELREQVQVSQEAVQKYINENDLLKGTRTLVSTEKLSELNSQLVKAKAQKAEAEARFKQIKKLQSDDLGISGIPQIFNAELIQSLRLRQTDLEARLAELKLTYGDRHPFVVQTKTEIEKIESALDSEMEKIISGIESEYIVAKARVESLEQGLRDASGEQFEDNEASVRLEELEREAASNRLIFNKFLETYKQSDDQEQLHEPEARVVSYAIVPSVPSYPNKMLLLSLSAFVSLFIGLVIAILIEKLDNTYKSANQLENSLRFPCFALIPQVEKLDTKKTADYILKKPSSTVAESVRTLRMVINLRHEEDRAKVVTMTSSFPGEGKTTLSTWLARLAAKSGERVILIDADLRRPSVHRALGISNDVTIVDYLTGEKELDEVIQKDAATGLHMMLASSVPNSALDLVSSAKMKKLVESLKQIYDLVIIDSPACLAVSDARVLAKMSDQTLYSVSWDRTPREVVSSGVKQFSDIGYQSLAFVLNNVDVKRHVRYGYGDTVYYYGRYKEYYAN